MSDVLNSREFALLIGGMEVSSKEKEKNLSIIKEAIISNNQGNKPIKIENQTFARSYPESLELVKQYYDSLFNAEVANIKGWDGYQYINRYEAKKRAQSRIKREMIETLIIFAPLFIEEEIIAIKTKFGISTIEVGSLLNNYKKIITYRSRIMDLGEEQEKYRIAQTIYQELVINGITKQEFCIRFNIANETVDRYIELLKIIDKQLYDEVRNKLKNNSTKRYNSLKHLTIKIGTHCKNRLEVNTPNGVIKMPFTMLDYYSLTNYEPKDLLKFINNSNNFDINNKEEMNIRSYARKFLQNNQNLGGFVSEETVLKTRLVAGKEDNLVQMNEEICKEIFMLFSKENIPNYRPLVEKAFYRYAVEQPILPIKSTEEPKSLELPGASGAKLTKQIKH